MNNAEALLERLNENHSLSLDEYEALIEAADTKDDLTITEALGEISSFRIPQGDAENLDKIRECFDKKDYEGIKNLSLR